MCVIGFEMCAPVWREGSVGVAGIVSKREIEADQLGNAKAA